MFTGATKDSTRMPPRCCTFLQIHTAVATLTDKEASEYRAKLDEWITLDKVYCPASACSAFISEKNVPPIPTDSAVAARSLKSVLGGIVDKVSTSPAARFFRGEPDITMLPGYSAVVTKHIDLGAIAAYAEAGRYASVNALTRDMNMIVTNALTYNKAGHPVANTAKQLFDRYLEELAAAMDKMVGTSLTAPVQAIFACPTCHIGICAKCRQVEHGKSPCDTTAGDAELAMLKTYGYKRCPLCKHAVRKMFGCSHMQCVCGSHWCWSCQRSTDQCEGSCDEVDSADDEDVDSDGDIAPDEPLDEPLEEGEDEDDIGGGAGTMKLNPLDGRPEPLESKLADPGDAPQVKLDLAPASELRTVNLDGGGERRWGGGEVNFGDEPEDEQYIQIWSCTHNFDLYYSKDDGHVHGDETRMECNTCFSKVLPTSRPANPAPKQPVSTKKRGRHVHRPWQPPQVIAKPVVEVGAIVVKAEKKAWECGHCRLVVCVGCRDKHKARQSDEEG
ncbi:hypothetical protein LTR08_008817 [Meristemomyces frigidus]|nr:hypothetical protein LTR08_008817 [Meristemomyces frigidus]